MIPYHYPNLALSQELEFQPLTEQTNEKVLMTLKQNESNTELPFSQKQLFYSPIYDKDMKILTRFSGLQIENNLSLSISLHQVSHQLVNAIEVKIACRSICM